MACNHTPRPLTRREALTQVGGGFGLVAFANMINSSVAKAETNSGGLPGALKTLHFKPRAKRVIFLFSNGGMSHVDTFDHKPMLAKYDGQPLPGGAILTQRKTGNLMKSPYQFQRYGKADTMVSELWPNVGGISDKICVVNSMYADIPNHEPSITLMNTGANVIGRPSLGSWITYGLGSENQNLPGYVVLCPSQPITIGTPLWSSAFLPAMYQGTYVKNEWIEGEPFKAAKVIPNVTNSDITAAVQRRDLKFLNKLNAMNLEKVGEKDSQLEASIKTMETAFAMQTSAPEVFDVSKESKAVLDMYGPGSTALGCLMAVRLAEKGVRMVQVYYSKGDPWDAHADIMSYKKLAKDSDRPFAAVVRDLEQRGMLEDTLVIGGTEFGRTPALQTANDMVGNGVVNGRDHNHYGFSLWLAGGGIKGGIVHGATDDFGYKAVEKKVHVHDLHATILYLLGIDHLKLTYPYSGREFRLTDTAGEVVHDIIA
ncbi:MAG: hypothetical protein QOJ99_2569 [Bryobacterales bacterium]|nr:hypothetical protein [Bryobacterales bacterium]